MASIGKAGNTSILLESGTNELEIVEFSICGNVYGINVAKVREIIKFPDKIISVPDAHPSVEGIVNLRGKVIPIINLAKHLGKPGEIDRSKSHVIVTEFNQSTAGFCVDAVDTIRRLSWTQIESPTGVLASEGGVVVAIIKFDDRMILLLDFEKITADIHPDSALHGNTEHTPEDKDVDRSSIKVVIAEDSKYIMKIIVDTLTRAGYQVQAFSDGQMAWEYLTTLLRKEKFSRIDEHVNVLITDIEMPRMDGLHLVKNIKDEEKLKSLPCIVFSSLINDEMILKCKSVGADGQISKPELGDLVSLVDSFILSPGER